VSDFIGGTPLDLVLAGGRILDPGCDRDEVGCVGIADGRIAAIAPELEGRERVDCTGLVVLPGLIDIHCHFREPGGEEAETIATGLASAAAGGFTAVAVMANTSPAIDTPEAVRFQLDRAAEADLGRLFVVAAATRARQGRELVDYGELVAAGAVAFSDDGDTIADPEVMRGALAGTASVGKLLLAHEVDPSAQARGVMREGATAAGLGVPGISDRAEDEIVRRDLGILEYCPGAHLHVQHLATAGAVELLRAARARGLAASAEVTPHHLALTDEAVAEFGSAAKMAPPLASAAGRDALRAALVEGVISVIASDHAPHPAAAKARPLPETPNGIIGLETSLPVLLRVLVHELGVPLGTVISALTCNPARLLGLDAGDLAVGRPADITVFDPDAEITIDASRFRSLSRNTPFDGYAGRGRMHAVFAGGLRIA